jgi:hypothetical protein
MWNCEQLAMATAAVRLLLRDQVGSHPGDLAPDASALTGEDRDLRFLHVLFANGLTYWTAASGRFNRQRKRALFTTHRFLLLFLLTDRQCGSASDPIGLLLE